MHLAAPGAMILSTTPNNTYKKFSGTSMATPHVAGLAALLLSKDPTLTNEEIRQLIRIKADDDPRCLRHLLARVDK